jgi:hypothetical protein
MITIDTRYKSAAIHRNPLSRLARERHLLTATLATAQTSLILALPFTGITNLGYVSDPVARRAETVITFAGTVAVGTLEEPPPTALARFALQHGLRRSS